MGKKASSDPKKTLKIAFGNSPDQHRAPLFYIVNIIQESCQEAFNLPSFTTPLQTIKSHFFDRNYDAVFQNPAHLPVYSARYAPSRALCYYHLFLEHPILMKTLEGPSTILCIGSGAGSELVGISAAMVHANPVPKTKEKKTTTSSSGKSKDKEDKEDKEDKKDKEAIPKESPTQESDDPALDLKKMDIPRHPQKKSHLKNHLPRLPSP
ncbi:hypothetical protein BGZ93_002326 [Podila epicladia]|nr:hypothetical protein BGZ92_003645 [Podila epicladia]KAG0082659.1 hypothetical protein BGZ93_002326 [Podila epicladia]